MSKSKFLSAAHPTAGFGFASVVFGWDMHDQAYTRELLIGTKANGFRDLTAIVDLSTFRRLPWEKNIPFFLCSLNFPETGEPLDVDPRSLLGQVVKGAEEKGWKCMSGAEFEVSRDGSRSFRCRS